MSQPSDLHALARAWALGAIDRRAFVRGALGLGVSASAVSALLAACGGGETPKPPEPAPVTPSEPAAPPAPAPLGEMEKELKIYNWSDYIAEDTVANFEKEHGVKVTYDTFESNEEVLAKLQAGASGYDLVVPSGYTIQVLLAQDLLEPLRVANLPNAVNIAAQFRKTTFDPLDRFTIPWQWSMTGIAYRKDKVKAPPESWGVFHDATLAGKMTMMDDMRDVIGSWLRYRGKSVNSTEAGDLAAAKADAIAAKKNIQSFISAAVKGPLVAGDVWIAQLWNGDTAQATLEQKEIAWLLPKEGSMMAIDCLCIPKGAANLRAAHAFMDYVLRPDVGAAISNFTGYGSPNSAAMASITTPVPLPTPEEMTRVEFQVDLGAATQLWDQVWTEIKAG